MIIPYGYYKEKNGKIRIEEKRAETVRKIYNLYLEGFSLNRIAGQLAAEGIPSPFGKGRWTVQTIDNLLSNEKYIYMVIPELYVKAQLEKQKRTNKSADNKRKTVRYNSSDVLSGLLVCGECGKNYRRITRKDGKIVWRCADRVENGKQAVCQNNHSVLECEVKRIICNHLEIDQFDASTVKDSVARIEISANEIVIIPKSEQCFDIAL